MLWLLRFCSVSGMFADAQSDSFPAILRKKAGSLLRRVRGNRNTVLKCIADSDSQYNNVLCGGDCPLIEHMCSINLSKVVIKYYHRLVIVVTNPTWIFVVREINCLFFFYLSAHLQMSTCRRGDLLVCGRYLIPAHAGRVPRVGL
jgi:hypothetical protein